MDVPNNDNVEIVKIKCKKRLDNEDSDSEYVCDICPGVYKNEKKLTTILNQFCIMISMLLCLIHLHFYNCY